MTAAQQTAERLAAIPNLTVSQNVPLARYTRFGIGGPAAVLAATADRHAFVAAARAAREAGARVAIIAGGTNLIVSDRGFDGVVLRYTASELRADGCRVDAEAGAELQALVDFTIRCGLKGLETMTGIPGSVGAAVYGNAGAYGRSMSDVVRRVHFFDGERAATLDRAGCEFSYRDSIFKRHKDWIIFSAELELEPSEPAELLRTAEEIRKVRDRKYPPEMKCAGSIFKNLSLAELPEEVARLVPQEVIREGKVPAGYFLEQAGAKGRRRGDIQVADYHANLIFNAGAGTAADLCALIAELKALVWERFGLELEEEVQYVGFDAEKSPPEP